MAELTFRVAVSKIVEPFLKTHGFVAIQRRKHRVLFSREYRGYPNSVDIEHVWMGMMTYMVRVSLSTPKCPYPGNDHFAGYPAWVMVKTPEELMVGLTAMREVLEGHALEWFEVYTPGNVPPWEERVTAEIVPLLAQYGFVRDPKVVRFDLVRFNHLTNPARSVALNLQVPKRISVGLFFDRPGISKDHRQPFSYANEAEFYQTLTEIRDYLQAAVPPWMEREPI